MHENAWNMWLNGKGKGIKDLLVLEDKNLGEICGRKRQKIYSLDRSKRESEKGVWKDLKIMKNTLENSF